MTKAVHVFILLALVCGPAAILAATADTDVPQPAPAAAAAVENPATVIPDNTTTTSTTTPETTTESTNSTSTSTTSSTSTTTTTSTTTPKTTTAGPTPAPGPVPPPTPNHWTVKNGTNFCLLVDMAVQANLTYKTQDGTWNYTLYDVPANAALLTGECRANESAFLVSWDNNTNMMDLAFKLNVTKKEYQMTLVLMLNVAYGQFPGAVAQKINLTMKSDAMIPQGMSYHCNRQQMFNATEVIDVDQDDSTHKGHKAHVALSKVQWQAFHDRPNEGYDLAKDCDAIDTPDIVPIAVGCALAGLVVIVLLGYLVGRHRSQNRGGYLSM